MTTDPLHEYLSSLRRELRRRGFSNAVLLAELESHLLDSVEQGLRQGKTPEEAQQTAIERFGPPGRVAHQFLKESFSMRQKLLLLAALVLGLLIAFVDSQPGWDDTGITAGALLIGGGIIGLLLEKRPWLYALAFGIWIPLAGLVLRHDPMMLIVLIFPFVGVFSGWLVNKLFRKAIHSS